VPLRGLTPYLFLLYVLFFPRTFGFSSRMCRFGVPCSETRRLYLNTTGASLRGSFRQSCTCRAIQFPFTAQNHFAPSIPDFPPFSRTHLPLLFSEFLRVSKFP